MTEELKWITEPRVIKLVSMDCAAKLIDIAHEIETKDIENPKVKEDIRRKIIEFEDTCSKTIKREAIMRV